MTKAKQRTAQHLIDEDGQQLLRQLLPKRWVLREYRPDYGLDYALEIFQEEGGTETLGEHIFIQLKSKRAVEPKPLKLFARGNVEKHRESLDKGDLVGSMDTIRFPLERSELVTVERMGVGVPVLLVVADITAQKCYFVCLNDYIDKILAPRFDDYRSKKSRTIHVPVVNDVADSVVGLTALRWYGKRAKLLAAFQRIIYQDSELEYAWGTSQALPMARYFASRLVQYDFWDETDIWSPTKYYGDAVKRFLATNEPGLMDYSMLQSKAAFQGIPHSESDAIQSLKDQEVRELWKLLAALPRNFEDICREWFLPTGLSYLTAYANSESNDGTTGQSNE